MEIKVLGLGCKNCKNLLNLTKAAAKATGIDSDVAYVTDMAEIAASGVLQMPGLIVNGQIKVAGRVPSLAEIIKILKAESV